MLSKGYMSVKYVHIVSVYDDILWQGHMSIKCLCIVNVYDDILKKGHMFLHVYTLSVCMMIYWGKATCLFNVYTLIVCTLHLAANDREVPLHPGEVSCACLACLDFHGTGFCHLCLLEGRHSRRSKCITEYPVHALAALPSMAGGLVKIMLMCALPPSLALGRPCHRGHPASHRGPLCMPWQHWLPWHGAWSKSCLCAWKELCTREVPCACLDFLGMGLCQNHVYAQARPSPALGRPCKLGATVSQPCYVCMTCLIWFPWHWALTSIEQDFVEVMLILQGRGFGPGWPLWHLAAHVREFPLHFRRGLCMPCLHRFPCQSCLCAARGFVCDRPLCHLAAHIRQVPLHPSHVPCACLGCLDFLGMQLCQCHVYMQAGALHFAALSLSLFNAVLYAFKFVYYLYIYWNVVDCSQLYLSRYLPYNAQMTQEFGQLWP